MAPAVCGVQVGALICKRPAGHEGGHRCWGLDEANEVVEFIVMDSRTGEVLPPDHLASQIVNEPRTAAKATQAMRKALRDLALKGWSR